MCKSLGCTKGAIDDIYCFDCREIKVQKNKRRREEWEESFNRDMTQYGSNLAAFGTSLISVSKRNKMFLLSDTPLFSVTECHSINEWMSRSSSRVEAIDWDCPNDKSRYAIDCIITFFTYRFFNSRSMQLLWNSQRGRGRTPPECVQRLLAVLRRWHGNDTAFILKVLTSDGACRR